MKNIGKDELYQHVSSFLATRGVALKQGSYTKAVKNGCSILTDAINLGQEGFEKAKTGLDKTLHQMRQAVHEATAPKPPPATKAGSAPRPAAPASAERTATQKNPSAKGGKARTTAPGKPAPKRAAKSGRKSGA